MKKWILVIGLLPFSLSDEMCHSLANDRRIDGEEIAFSPSENSLKIAYQALEKILPLEVAQGLKQAQQNWLFHRERACRQAGKINTECYYRANRERIDYLRDRLRECQAGHCQIHAITQQSWYTY